MSDDTKDLRTALVEALLATDAETAWYYDRRKDRVVSVSRGVVSDKLLRARDVEEDELRFVEVPALTEAEIHEWALDFTEASGREDVASWLDDKPGAHLRFEARLEKRAPDLLTAWRRSRHERTQAAADAWLTAVRSERVPGGAGLAEEE